MARRIKDANFKVSKLCIMDKSIESAWKKKRFLFPKLKKPLRDRFDTINEVEHLFST